MAVEETCYGRVSLIRATCPKCQSMSIVLDGRTTCHKELVDTSVTRTKRAAEAKADHRALTKKQRQELSDSQGGLCFYCFNAFGTMYIRGSTVGHLTLNVDHSVPYSYLQSSESHNLVAACHVCNMLKGNRLFDTIEEARAYVEAAWQKKRIMEPNPVL